MKSKILLVLLFASVAVSLYLTYDRALVRQEFEIYDEAIAPEEEF